MALDKIDAAYLLGLPDGGGPAESRTVDYKRDFTSKPGEIDGSELRADVSAFANAEGGDLVIGVDEAGGLPVKVGGISCEDANRLKLRLDGMLATIEPRLAYGLRVILLPSGRAVVIIRTRPSFAAPHRTSASGGFFTRSDSGKYPMSIDQVREAFVASAGLEGRLRSIRHARINLGDLPHPTALLHVMPLLSASRPALLDVIGYQKELAAACLPISLRPEPQINFEGFRQEYREDRHERAFSQWLRSGIREVAWASGITLGATQWAHGPSFRKSPSLALFRSGDVARTIVDEVGLARLVVAISRQTIETLSTLGIGPPYYLALSLRSCRGAWLGYFHEGRGFHVVLDGGHSATMGHLEFPEVAVESETANIPALLRPTFDHLANAFGLPRSNAYDGAGRWDSDEPQEERW